MANDQYQPNAWAVCIVSLKIFFHPSCSCLPYNNIPVVRTRLQNTFFFFFDWVHWSGAGSKTTGPPHTKTCRNWHSVLGNIITAYYWQTEQIKIRYCILRCLIIVFTVCKKKKNSHFSLRIFKSHSLTYLKYILWQFEYLSKGHFSLNYNLTLFSCYVF